MPTANSLPRIASPASSTAVAAGRGLEAHALEPRGTGRSSRAGFESIDFESMLIEQAGTTSSARAGAALPESTVEQPTNTASDAHLHWKSPGPQTAAASKQVASEVSREVLSGIPGQSVPAVFSLGKLSTLSLLSESHPDRSLESAEPGFRTPGIGSEVSSQEESLKRPAVSSYAAPAVSGQWSSEAAAPISRARTRGEASAAIEAKTNGQTDARADGDVGHAGPDIGKSHGMASTSLSRGHKNFSRAEVSQEMPSSVAIDGAPFQSFQLRAESGWSGSIGNLPSAVSGNASAHTGRAVLAADRPQPAVSANSSSDLPGDPKIRALSAATVQGATTPDSEADPGEQDSEQDHGIGKPAMARLTAAFSANLDRGLLPAGRDLALPSMAAFHGPANSAGAGPFQESPISAARSSSVALPDNSAKSASTDPYQRLDQVMSPGLEASPGSVLHASAGRVTVGVHDPVLGWVEIKTQSSAGQVSAALVTASVQSHTSLAAQLPSIAQYLTEHDVRVSHLGVEHQPAGSNASMSFDSSASRERSGEGSAAGRPEAGTESTERLEPSPSMTVQPAWVEGMEEGRLSYISVRV